MDLQKYIHYFFRQMDFLAYYKLAHTNHQHQYFLLPQQVLNQMNIRLYYSMYNLLLYQMGNKSIRYDQYHELDH